MKFRQVACGTALVAGLGWGAVWAENEPAKPAVEPAQPVADPDKPAQPAAEDVFKKLDTNSDGKVTSDEVGEDQKRFFDRLLRNGDKDGNGELSADEFKQAADSAGPGGSGGFGGRGGRGRGGFSGGGGDPGALFDRLDTNKDGKVTLDETPEQMRPLVERMLQESGKDSLTKEDFAQMRGRFGGRGGSEGGGPRPTPPLVLKLDADKDGKISKEELSALASKFDELDENKDGSLDARELLGPPPQGGQPGEGGPDGPPGARGGRFGRGAGSGGPPAEGGDAGAGRRGRFGGGAEFAQRMMDRMDADKDGKLTGDEIPAFMQNRMKDVDKNSDGSIDLDELKAAAPAPRGGRPPQESDQPADPPKEEPKADN